MLYKLKKVISLSDWDDLVKKTYGRKYSFQQQDGCKSRGFQHFIVPNNDKSDFENEEVPEKVNHPEMGVSFSAWLKRDPAKLLPDGSKFSLELWWARNFYPDFQAVANDLHKRGLLEAGDYSIEIDW